MEIINELCGQYALVDPSNGSIAEKEQELIIGKITEFNALSIATLRLPDGETRQCDLKDIKLLTPYLIVGYRLYLRKKYLSYVSKSIIRRVLKMIRKRDFITAFRLAYSNKSAKINCIMGAEDLIEFYSAFSFEDDQGESIQLPEIY